MGKHGNDTLVKGGECQRFSRQVKLKIFSAVRALRLSCFNAENTEINYGPMLIDPALLVTPWNVILICRLPIVRAGSSFTTM